MNRKKEWYCSISTNPECFIRDNEGQIVDIYQREAGKPICEETSCEHMKLNTDMERCEDFDPEDYDYEMRNAHYATQGIFFYFRLSSVMFSHIRTLNKDELCSSKVGQRSRLRLRLRFSLMRFLGILIAHLSWLKKVTKKLFELALLILPV